VLRGAALPFGNPSVDAEKRRMFEQAIALDPDYGLAYALLALVVFLDWWTDMTGSDLALDHAFELARKAVALDENDSTSQHVLGWMHLHRKSFELAEEYFHRSLELNPNDPELVVEGGFLYAFLGKPNDAIDWLKQAKHVDPYFSPIKYWHTLGYTHFIAHR
jgi:Tfp pilus assembly protein PilF